MAKKKTRQVTFSIVVLETTEVAEKDLTDGSIEIEFTGEINAGLCLSAMRDGLHKALEDEETNMITGKLTNIFLCR